MEFKNESIIVEIFSSLDFYCVEEFEAHISFFNTATTNLKIAIKTEANLRLKNLRKQISASFTNETIINSVKEWFVQFLIVHQTANLLYFGFAYTEEEKSFFNETFNKNNDFKSILHPEAYYSFNTADRGEFAFQNNFNESMIVSHPLCCFSTSFFSDDLDFNESENSVVSKGAPTLLSFSDVKFNVIIASFFFFFFNIFFF
jgi:hypothetical protein